MACAHYQIDMSGKSFGDCKCGHAKAEHSDASLHSPPAPAPPASKNKAAAADGDYHGPCDHYAVEMTASEFGLCKCGFKKIDHGKPRELFMTKKDNPEASKPAPPPPVAVAPPPPPPPAPKEVTKGRSEHPCNHFEIDIRASAFGHCKCGHSRDEHKAAGTYVEPETRVFAGGHIGDIKRSTIAPTKAAAHPGKQAKPCLNYQVDMNGATFGDCFCGHAKMKHKQFKKPGHDDDDTEDQAPPAATEPVKVIVRDGTHPCELFELDLKNTGGYGACFCGFTRIDHEEFHHDPEEWHKIKSSLTKPKDFT